MNAGPSCSGGLWPCRASDIYTCKSMIGSFPAGWRMRNMAREILAFILCTSGWVLISSTLPTDYWKVSSIDGTVITTATFWSNLWKTCVTDSTGVSNCKDFPSMLALDGYIQVCRGLMITAVCLGFFGSIFALIGMKCTKIGGPDKFKARVVSFAGFNFACTGSPRSFSTPCLSRRSMSWAPLCSSAGLDPLCVCSEERSSPCPWLTAAATRVLRTEEWRL
ncbi:claudin-10 isoform X3 [Danio aesculapii]|uniref:claudin-10 isoform X3 n=1 Tax=Danio aesculapii TaxID=1142201 RepID=UPI0024BFBFE7|nr:claudin-10 isoform X3 [Danio aesculapii]